MRRTSSITRRRLLGALTAGTVGTLAGCSATPPLSSGGGGDLHSHLDGEVEARNSGNLVLYDELTRSYWSQFIARAICGEREGDRLTMVPSTVTHWSEWRADHPRTDVLLSPPHSTEM